MSEPGAAPGGPWPLLSGPPLRIAHWAGVGSHPGAERCVAPEPPAWGRPASVPREPAVRADGTCPFERGRRRCVRSCLRRDVCSADFRRFSGEQTRPGRGADVCCGSRVSMEKACPDPRLGGGSRSLSRGLLRCLRGTLAGAVGTWAQRGVAAGSEAGHRGVGPPLREMWVLQRDPGRRSGAGTLGAQLAAAVRPVKKVLREGQGVRCAPNGPHSPLQPPGT